MHRELPHEKKVISDNILDADLRTHYEPATRFARKKLKNKSYEALSRVATHFLARAGVLRTKDFVRPLFSTLSTLFTLLYQEQ
jgi:hypothetical protein